jgi:hypothetical protein
LFCVIESGEIDIQSLINEVQNFNLEYDFEEQDLNVLCDQYFGHIHNFQEMFADY